MKGKHEHPPTTTSTVKTSTPITVLEVVDLSQEEEQTVSQASTVVAIETSTPTPTVASTDAKIQSKAPEETTSPRTTTTEEVTPNITVVKTSTKTFTTTEASVSKDLIDPAEGSEGETESSGLEEDLTTEAHADSKNITKDLSHAEDIATTTVKAGGGKEKYGAVLEEQVGVGLLPEGFREKKKLKTKIANKYKNLQSKSVGFSNEENVHSYNVENSVELQSFGKVTTTTVDPIAELLSNVEILDIKSYIPIGYTFVKEDQESPEDTTENSQGNINDLLFDEELRRKKLRRKSKQLKDLKNEETSAKPGKLNGRLLAKIAKEMKDKAEAEEELYLATFGGTKEKYGWRDIDGGDGGDEEDSKTEKVLEIDPNHLFESLLGNNVDHKVQPVKPKLSRPLTSPPRTATSTTSTTAAYRTSTLGQCGQFCSLTGGLHILAGLTWQEELLHDFTVEFQENKRSLERLMTENFQQVYFGSAFEFCSVDAFSRLGDAVIAEFYLQFSGIVFNVTSADLTRSWIDLLDVEDGNHKLGDYVIDVDASYFRVVDTEVLNDADNLVFAKYGVELPDWAWLVVMAGTVCTFIMALLGILFGLQKMKLKRKIKMRVLNAKTLEALKNNNSFDMMDLDHGSSYEKDKRDMWTLQRAIQNESRKTKLLRVSSQDSGRGSGSSSGGPFNGVFQRFPSLRGRQATAGVSVNDSHAGLLNSYDNTGFQDDTDIDTSYENSDSDSQDRRHGAELSRQKILGEFEVEVEVGQEGGRDLGSGSESGVSDGPSERL